MIDVAITAVKETVKESTKETFKNEVGKKMSPNELLTNSDGIGISGSSKEVADIKKEIYSFEKMNNYLPENGGEWSGEKGNSIWKPDRDQIPGKPQGNETTWGEILDRQEIDGIEFKDGEPDFSTTAEGTVEIDDFSDDRNANYTQADETLAEQWTEENKDGKIWTAQDIKEYRKENDLSWHERSDMKTMDLVSQDVHGNISHSGGISAIKDIQNQNNERTT